MVAPATSGFATTREYDRNGNLRKVRRQSDTAGMQWQITETQYSRSGKPVLVIDPQGNRSAFQYDTVERLRKTTDARGIVTENVYDELGRVTATKVGGVTMASQTYTHTGQLGTVKDGNNHQTAYTYDGFDRRKRTTYPDSSYEEVTGYDAAGNVLTTQTRAGQSIAFTYDNLNRGATRTIPASPSNWVFTSKYDVAGRLKQVQDSRLTAPYDQYTWSYDKPGRVLSALRPDGTAAGAKTVSYPWDANGNRTRVTYPDSYYVTYGYDVLNRLDQVKESGTTLIADYDYDPLSRRTLLTYGNGTSAAYTYEADDDLATLTQTFVGESVQFGYGYTGTGQRNRQTVSNNSYLWRPAAPGTVSYTANNVNQYSAVTGLTPSYDTNGHLAGDGTSTFGYDAVSQLTSWTQGATAATLSYDPLGRRASKTVGAAVTQTVWDGAARLAEYDASNTLTRRYVYGADYTEPVQVHNVSGGTTYTVHGDGLGSVIALTTTTGAVQERYAYGPYGESSGASALMPLRYTAQALEQVGTERFSGTPID